MTDETIRPIIFLDIDGVLNAHDYDETAQSCTITSGCVRNFNRILFETDAEIVLSSAWRYMIHGGAMSLKGFEYMLRTHEVHCVDRLIGVTVTDEFIAGRGRQITWWFEANPDKRGAPYLVIDDGGTDSETKSWHDMGIPAEGHPVVWTDGEIGLTNTNATRAIEILEGQEVTP